MNSKYKHISILPQKYYFDINHLNYPDLRCVICNKMLVNAYQNVCGCRYCWKCIESDCNSDCSKCYPGYTDYCSDSLVNLKHNNHIVKIYENI